MRLYILHSAAINADGELSIDCSAPFSSENEAQSMQNAMMRAYMQQFSYPQESWSIETAWLARKAKWNYNATFWKWMCKIRL